MPVLVITPEHILLGLILLTFILIFAVAVVIEWAKKLKRKWKAWRTKP